MKSIFFLSLIVLFPLFAISQEIHYGLSSGLTMSRFFGESDKLVNSLSNELNDYEDISGFSFRNLSRIGFAMGFFIDYQIKNSFSIQPEMQYIQKGAKFVGSGWVATKIGNLYYPFFVNEDIIIQSNYIEITVLAKYSLDIDNLKTFLFAGPGISYLASSKTKIIVEIEDESDSKSGNFKGFKKTDAGIIFGGGIALSKTNIIEIRYHLGLIPLFKNKNEYKIQNSSFTFNLTYIFK